MKNCKITSSIAILLTATTLLSGCTKSVEEEMTTELATPETTTEECTHLIVDFGNQTVVFKECEGYDIGYTIRRTSSLLSYNISKDEKELISGYATEYNLYNATHEQVSEIEQQAIENGAYVYKIQK